MRSVKLRGPKTIPTITTLLHNLMVQAGRCQELREHVLHSQGRRPGKKPFLALPHAEGWKVQMSAMCCVLGSFLAERKRGWRTDSKGDQRGQAEQSACRSVPTMWCKVEPSIVGHTGITASSNRIVTFSRSESCYHLSMTILLLLYYNPNALSFFLP